MCRRARAPVANEVDPAGGARPDRVGPKYGKVKYGLVLTSTRGSKLLVYREHPAQSDPLNRSLAGLRANSPV